MVPDGSVARMVRRVTHRRRDGSVASRNARSPDRRTAAGTTGHRGVPGRGHDREARRIDHRPGRGLTGSPPGGNPHSPLGAQRRETRQVSVLHVSHWPAHADTAQPTFVLLHGWACDSTDWAPLVDRFRALGTVLAVDLPGSGNSRSDPGPYTLPHAVTRVAEILRDHRSAPILVGHSAGCEVAVALADDPAVRARAIVAVDPAYGFPDGDRDRVRAVARRLETHDPRTVALEYFSAIDGTATPEQIREQHPSRLRATDAALRETFREFAFGPGALHFSPECDERHRRRTVPLLALYRNAARAAPARGFATHAGDRVITRDDAGHWLHLEDPDRFISDLTDWLAELR